MPNSQLVTTQGQSHYRGKHNVTYVYRVDRRDAVAPIIRNPLQVVQEARAYAPDPVPQAGQQLLGFNVYAQRFDAQPTRENRAVWDVRAHFLPPPDGEDEQQNDPALLPWERPPTYDIRFIEKEWVITKAWNLSNLHGTRDAKKIDAVDPGENDLEKQILIVNSLLKDPDAPAAIDSERNIVFFIKRNYQFLNGFIDLQKTFAKSTNSDVINLPGTPAVQIPQHVLRYRGTFSSGLTSEEVDPEVHPEFPDGQVWYYPTTTEIEWVAPDTFLRLNNVSYDYWDPAKADPDDGLPGTAIRFTQKDERDKIVPIPVPQNVTLTGEKSKTPVELKYRYLFVKQYQSFFPQ